MFRLRNLIALAIAAFIIVAFAVFLNIKRAINSQDFFCNSLLDHRKLDLTSISLHLADGSKVYVTDKIILTSLSDMLTKCVSDGIVPRGDYIPNNIIDIEYDGSRRASICICFDEVNGVCISCFSYTHDNNMYFWEAYDIMNRKLGLELRNHNWP